MFPMSRCMCSHVQVRILSGQVHLFAGASLQKAGLPDPGVSRWVSPEVSAFGVQTAPFPSPHMLIPLPHKSPVSPLCPMSSSYQGPSQTGWSHLITTFCLGNL